MAKSIINNKLAVTCTKLLEDTSLKCHNSYIRDNSNSNEDLIERQDRNNSSKNSADIKDPFRVFHQNIRGLRGKMDELGLHFLDGALHVICLTEHHLMDYETDKVSIPKYKLGAKYCRLSLKNGGVCIYALDSLTYDNNDLTNYSKDQDLEICVIKLNTLLNNIIILCLYRAPVGNFKNFLDTMEKTLDLLHKPNTEFIICGDININYMEASNNRKSLDNLLAIYNLRSMVHFPTRIVNNSISMTDNIFIDASRNYTTEPYINGLSDHEAQILTIHNVPVKNITTDPYYIRTFNKNAITEFQLQLSWESWNKVFSSNDVNLMFNSFLNIYLRYYHSSFIKKERKQAKNNQWITKGIRISCNRKKYFFDYADSSIIKVSKHITRNTVKFCLG